MSDGCRQMLGLPDDVHYRVPVFTRDHAPTLFDPSPADVLTNHPGPSHCADPVTSHEAALRNAPRSGSQRARCLLALAAAADDGLTDFELSIAAGLCRPHVAGNRRLELSKLGLVEATDVTRPTDTGASALVHRVTPVGAWVAAEMERDAS